MTCRRGRPGVPDELSTKSPSAISRTTPVTSQGDPEYVGIAYRWTEMRRALLDLSHDHVSAVGGTSERRVDNIPAERVVPTGVDHVVSGAREAVGQDVRVGHGADTVASERLRHPGTPRPMK